MGTHWSMVQKMKIQIESTGHLDLMTFVIAIGFILATIQAMTIYVLISILPEVAAWLSTFDAWLRRVMLLLSQRIT
jgi:hypothetical protein